MTDEKPKLPTKEGLKRAQEAVQKRRERQPSDKLVRIIDEITREKFPDVNEKDIAAKPARAEKEGEI